MKSKQPRGTFITQLNNEKHPVIGGRWLSHHCRMSSQLWTDTFGRWGGKLAFSPGLHAGHRRFKRDWFYSLPRFPKCLILTSHSPPCWVKDHSPFSWETRAIFSLLTPPPCTSRQPRQAAWPGHTVEAVQSNCSILTFTLTAALQLQTALLKVCCSDLYLWKLACFFQL